MFSKAHFDMFLLACCSSTLAAVQPLPAEPWDKASDSQIIDLASDTVNSIVFDPARGEYAMFCRAKDRYLAGQTGMLDTGESRHIARLSGKDLWSKWEGAPQSILIADELDLEHGFNRFYGMPARVHGGITWGFLWSFKLNTDIWTELAWSRNGVSFERLPARPRVIDLGPEGTWDDGMVFGSPRCARRASSRCTVRAVEASSARGCSHARVANWP